MICWRYRRLYIILLYTCFFACHYIATSNLTHSYSIFHHRINIKPKGWILTNPKYLLVSLIFNTTRDSNKRLKILNRLKLGKFDSPFAAYLKQKSKFLYKLNLKFYKLNIFNLFYLIINYI